MVFHSFFLDNNVTIIYTIVLEKRDIIKTAEEKFLDYLRKQEDKFRTIIIEFTTEELERTGLCFRSDQLPVSVADILGCNNINRLSTSKSIYAEKLAHSIFDILQYNDKIKLPIHELSYVRRIISMLESMSLNETPIKSEMITDDFQHLSLYLLSSPLKGKESFNVLMGFISLNIKKGLLDYPGDVLIIDSLIAERRGLNSKKIFDLFIGENLNTLLNTEDEKLSDGEIQVKKTLLEISEESAGLKQDQFLDYHRVIQSSYLDKADSYKKEDIDKIIASLDGLGVCSELCQRIKATLNRELSKRMKKDSINSYVIKRKQPSKESKYISDAEYKQIKKEIGKYWDTYKMEAKKDLTEEERLYCAYLLLKIGTDSDLVRTFFHRTEEKSDLENPIGFYNHTYDKLKFYEQKCNFQQSLDNIQDYLQEIFITNSEDYQFWKDEIKKELSTMVQKLPQSYEYELRKASAYCKKKQR